MTEQPTATPSETEQPPEQKPVAQRLKDFKEAYIAAASQIDKLKEPLEQLVQIRDYLD